MTTFVDIKMEIDINLPDLNKSGGWSRRSFARVAMIGLPLTLTACSAGSTEPVPEPTSGDNVSSAVVIRGTGHPSTDTKTLYDGITTAARERIPALLIGNFSINGAIRVPSRVTISGFRAEITQTQPLTPIFRTDGSNSIRFDGLILNGYRKDYTNSSHVFAATGVYINKGSKDIQIVDCQINGVAGAGIALETVDQVVVRDCRIEGPGAGYIKGSRYNYSAGIVAHSNGGSWSAEFNDISGYSQGIVTDPTQSNYRIIGNRIHDIPGQHGLYLESVDRGVIEGNIIWNTGLLGMKIQVPAGSKGRAGNVAIVGNVFQSLGDTGILITNLGPTTAQLARIVIGSNVIDGSGADGILLHSCAGALVHDNIVASPGRDGIAVRDSSDVEIHHNQLSSCGRNGISVTNSHDWTIDFNKISLDGISLHNDDAGVVLTRTSSDGLVRGNRTTSSAGSRSTALAIVGTSKGSNSLNGIAFEKNWGSGSQVLPDPD